MNFTNTSSLFETLPSLAIPGKSQGHWELNLMSNKLVWDEQQYGLYGYMPGEICIDDEYFITKTTHSSDVKRITQIITDALKKDNGYTFKRRIVKKNGDLGYAETHARIIRATSNTPNLIIGCTTDIGGLMSNGNYDFNDPKFFHDLYQNYHKAITAEVFKLIKDADMADDLCQDIFLKAWNHMSQYNTVKGGLFTWLVNIARNHCTDYFRSRSYNKSKDTCSLDLEFHDMADEMDNFSSAKSLLIQLNIEQRELIELLFIQGFTQTEVARIKNSPLGTVKTHSRQAIQALRKLAAAENN